MEEAAQIRRRRKEALQKGKASARPDLSSDSEEEEEPDLEAGLDDLSDDELAAMLESNLEESDFEDDF